MDFFGVVCTEIAPPWLLKYLPGEAVTKIKDTVVHAADIGELTLAALYGKLGDIVKVPARQVEEEWWSCVAIDDCVVRTITELQRNHKVALLSNAPAELLQQVLGKHNLTPLFDLIVVSSEEGCAKPGATIYQRTIERLAVPAQNTMVIDDNPANVRGALAVGMKGLVFTSCAQLRKALTDRGYLRNGA